MKRRCGNCRFHHSINIPHCRRYPPTLQEPIKRADNRFDSRSSWPVIGAENVCGEHALSWLKLWRQINPDHKHVPGGAG